ncbi:hypothetical protein [Halobellus sp. EA9]|uniref:hypothetical protein n=1 Tax=Halobellus sp. EA9 TaxID=3421647 RepID=UPI003EB761EE
MRQQRHTDSADEDAMAVHRLTRPAEQNRDLVERVDPGTDASLLPSLDNGLVLLDLEQSRGVPVVHSLVLDHLLLHDGPAFWIDARGYATTTSFAQLSPSPQLLDRISVARGFTPYQHYGAVCGLSDAVARTIREDTPVTPSLLVAPALDAQYRAADVLPERQARTLQARTLARLTAYADAYDVPVLMTRTAADEFAAPIEAAAQHRLRCKQTRFGPRFVGEDFETLVYPVDDGSYYQTTLAYWRQLLGIRAEQVGIESARNTAQPRPASTVGSSVTPSGERMTLPAAPLQDAWLDTAPAGGP